MQYIINNDQIPTVTAPINLIKALTAVQLEMKSVKKSVENGFLKTKYADLAAVCDYAYPILAKHGLAISQPAVLINEKQYIKTMLLHTSGEYLESHWPITGVKQQELGSAASYARRYSLTSIIGLSASGEGAVDVEDDDGQAEANAAAEKELQFKPLPKNKNQLLVEIKKIVAEKKIDHKLVFNHVATTFKKEKVNELDINQLELLTKWLQSQGGKNE